MDGAIVERFVPAARAVGAVIGMQLLTALAAKLDVPIGAPFAVALLGLLLYRWLDRRALADFGLGVNRRALTLTGWGLVIVLAVGGLFLGVVFGSGLKAALTSAALMPAVLQAVLAAAGAEFLCRGYIFRTVDAYGLPGAASVAALLEMLAQLTGSLGQPLPLLLLVLVGTGAGGFSFAYMYYRTGSIWPGTVLHGAIAAAAAVLLRSPYSPIAYSGFIFPVLLLLAVLLIRLRRRWEGIDGLFAESKAA